MKRGRYGCRWIISGGGVQSGHSALRVTLSRALPLEALAADADPVAHRPVISLDEIQIAVGGIDDDRPWRLVGAVEDSLPLIGRRQSLLTRIGHMAWLIFDGHGATGLRADTVGIRR